MEIKIRYTFKRKSDGHIWQEIVPLESLEGKGDEPFIFKYNRGMVMSEPEWEIIGRDLWTGETYKDGSDIFCGDAVSYQKPYRTTQTHYGDNIPNGEYTEPMEPGIKVYEGIVVFKEGMFQIEDPDNAEFNVFTPIAWCGINWDLDTIKEAISWTRQTDGWFDDPEEGDLQYLITECARVETAEQLIEYLSGFEKIGDIYTSPELIQK